MNCNCDDGYFQYFSKKLEVLLNFERERELERVGTNNWGSRRTVVKSKAEFQSRFLLCCLEHTTIKYLLIWLPGYILRKTIFWGLQGLWKILVHKRNKNIDAKDLCHKVSSNLKTSKLYAAAYVSLHAISLVFLSRQVSIASGEQFLVAQIYRKKSFSILLQKWLIGLVTVSIFNLIELVSIQTW